MAQAWNLQKYVADAFKEMGAAVDAPEFALLEILLPDHAADRFDGREFLRLAFDDEVARETPDAEFVTYGSPLLDRLAEWGMGQGNLLRRFIVLPNVRVPPDLEARSAKDIVFPKCRRPSLTSAELVWANYLAFEFEQTLRADEKVEWVERIWVDLQSGAVLDDSHDSVAVALNAAVYDARPDLLLPLAPHVDLSSAYLRAADAARRGAQLRRSDYARSLQAQKKNELQKVARYYNGLADNLRRRLERTTDLKTKDDLETKLRANEADRARRREDLEKKYNATSESHLLRLLWYLVPSVRFVLDVRRRDRTFSLTTYYNLAGHTVVLPRCAICGSELHAVHFDDTGAPCCEAHANHEKNEG